MELTAQRKSELQEQRDSDYGQHALDRIHMKQTWRKKLKEQLTTEWSCKLTDAENLLASVTTDMSSKKRETQSLKDKLSKLASELASERSVAAQLRYNLGLTDTNLKAKVLEVTSQMECIQRLEETNGNLSQDKRKTDKAVNDLQNKLDNADDKIDDLEGKLEAGNEKLSTATEETMDARRRLEQVEKDLSAEKSANRTASLELLLRDAKRTTDTLSTDLRNERKRLEKERLSNASLEGCIRRLEQERMRSSEEKENSDKRNKELDLLLFSTKDNVKNLEVDALLYDAERACILQQLMAESTRLHCMEGKLPQDLARIPGECA